MKIEFMLTAGFIKTLCGMDKALQGATLDTLKECLENPARITDPSDKGLRPEILKSARGDAGRLMSIRVRQGPRIILAQREGAYYFLAAGKHDDMYGEVNNNGRQLLARADPTAAVGAASPAEVAALLQALLEEEAPGGAVADARPFPQEGASDVQLYRMGVPEDKIGCLRALKDMEQFIDEVSGQLEDSLCDRLFTLSTGSATAIELIREYEKTQTLPAGQAGQTGQNGQPAFQEAPSLVRSGHEQLAKILQEGRLEEWRTFLHPAQQRLAEARLVRGGVESTGYDGPVRVSGGAGTGKTVTAIYRAICLAKGLGNGEKLLFTTFTENLAQDIEQSLKLLNGGALPRGVEVCHIDKKAGELLRATGGKILYNPAELEPLWQQAASQAKDPYPETPTWYREEWEQVVAKGAFLTQEEYLQVARHQRGAPLYRQERERAWPVFTEYQKLLETRNTFDRNSALRRCVEQLPPAGLYKHVVVDEVQDFSGWDLRLIRALAGPAHPDDLFLVGDVRQRIYGNRPVLSQCGIHVPGSRSFVLRMNYRTRENVRRAASCLLEDELFDNMDGGLDDSARAYYSPLAKGVVQVRHAQNEAQEMEWILGELEKLRAQGVPLRNVCLTAPTNALVQKYKKKLAEQLGKVFEVKKTGLDETGQDGLRIATMHRVKGLEFQYMFLAAVNDGTLPHYPLSNETERAKAARKADKCLLYVAMTRARDGVFVSGFGPKKSPFLSSLEHRSTP
ncbi:3'-5' exonuclease [Acutalibacter caecimuris]|uniref:3'-5' exonuclease n=1 Tax=Acutalibacter caecimuris TaxID=3093657 RepID=UPI002AC94EA9|nr:3'-5' exonuclease [Acutalibacter sp. M00118]